MGPSPQTAWYINAPSFPASPDRLKGLVCGRTDRSRRNRQGQRTASKGDHHPTRDGGQETGLVASRLSSLVRPIRMVARGSSVAFCSHIPNTQGPILARGGTPLRRNESGIRPASPTGEPLVSAVQIGVRARVSCRTGSGCPHCRVSGHGTRLNPHRPPVVLELCPVDLGRVQHSAECVEAATQIGCPPPSPARH
jgi:hypothetical protein